ncbi:electron transport complex subunit RsxE [Levyella massiliensis]|uniref:electron transport complex subunit RsxE n=1 Tax=Levyella massiliensis TaxID=938289 RepID=UPI00038238F8|nr:electron transport complex subunit RsxE [Levyella massiliensis]
MDKLKEGMFSNNPVLVQLIGFCSVLAVSSTVLGAVGMSLSFMFVLILSNIVISLLRNFIPNEIRIPAFIVVIASFVTILQMCLQAYFEEIYNLLGIFLPLIVVNCIILGRAEAFASKNGVVASAIDGLVNGLGYGFVIITVAIVRELIGAGTLLGVRILPEAATIPFLLQPASSFILLGIFLAVMNQIKLMQAKKAKEKEAQMVAPAESQAIAE